MEFFQPGLRLNFHDAYFMAVKKVNITRSEEWIPNAET